MRTSPSKRRSISSTNANTEARCYSPACVVRKAPIALAAWMAGSLAACREGATSSDEAPPMKDKEPTGDESGGSSSGGPPVVLGDICDNAPTIGAGRFVSTIYNAASDVAGACGEGGPEVFVRVGRHVLGRPLKIRIDLRGDAGTPSPSATVTTTPAASGTSTATPTVTTTPAASGTSTATATATTTPAASGTTTATATATSTATATPTATSTATATVSPTATP